MQIECGRGSGGHVRNNLCFLGSCVSTVWSITTFDDYKWFSSFIYHVRDTIF